MSWLDKVINLAVQSAGSLIGTRPTLNFSGSGVTVTDDNTNNRVNVAISGAAASDATTTSKGIVQLAGDIAGTASSVTVAKVNGVSVSGTPSAGQVLTASGATAASWAAAAAGGASVGLYASRPAAGTAGRVYAPTDESAIAIDDGTIWRPVIDGYLCKPVLLSDLSTLVTVHTLGVDYLETQQGDGLYTQAVPVSSGSNVTNFSARLKSGASYAICRVKIANSSSSAGVTYAGAIMRESATGKAVTISPVLVYNAFVGVNYGQWNGTNNRVGFVDYKFDFGGNDPFVRISASGTSATVSISRTPFGPWFDLATLSGSFTASPDQVGVFTTVEQGTGSAFFEHFDGA